MLWNSEGQSTLKKKWSKVMNILQKRDDEAESVCRWAAARAGVIVLVPILGPMSLVANYTYMVARLGEIYGTKASSNTVRGFITTFAGMAIGTTLATYIPVPFFQVPLAVATTYGIGKAAHSWIKDGMPVDVEKYRKIFSDAFDHAKKNFKSFLSDKRKDQPLGDEQKAV